MTHTPLDIAWVLLCAALVMLMQAGFCCLESGLVRSKNSINVAFKNFVDFLLSSALYWVFGFALMFGASQGGLIGATGFFFSGEGTPWLLAFFIFQMMFCGTATTIISGAVAERMRFSGYLIVATIVAGLIYPVIGHWVWGGAESGVASGWLASIGFIDFAGTTVVHSVGGWVSLAAIIIIGPRLGRFDQGNATIHGHDLPLVTLGVFLLWFGWFGFNGGSTFGLTDEVPGILINTTISGAFGGLSALALSWRVLGRPDVGIIMNGALAGLVGITGSAHIMTTVAAMGIGLIAGGVMFAGTLLLERLKLDDVVGAFPVHGCGGVWGTLAIPLFGNPETWGTGLGRWDQFLVQAAGVGACFLWAFCLGYVLLWLINRLHPLRIDPDGERIGLNVAEHGASTEILDLLNEMDDQRRSGDFSQHVSVEPHTEIGQIARQYNRVLDGINAETRRREAAMSALERKTASLDLLQRISAAANRASEIEEAMQICVDEVCGYMDWPVGHVYVRESDGAALIATEIWHIEDPERFKRFRDATTGTRFGAGMGLVGRVLESGEPSWMSDVSSNPEFLRADSAKESGLKAGFAFPVLAGEDVVAVLDFFSEETAEPDETTLDLMASVGTQLGRVVERKRNEEQRFKAIVDNVPVLLFLRDLSGRFILVNDGYRDFYNLHGVDVRGRTLPDIFAGSDFTKEALKSAEIDSIVIEQDRIVEQELTAEYKGEPRYMATLRFPIHDMDGRVTAVGGVEIDLTERKRAEQALAQANTAKDAALRELGESEQRYALAVEGANDGLWDWNLLTGEIYVSPRAKRIMGLETDAEVLTPQEWNARVHPDDIERLIECEKAHLEGEADFYSCEYRVLDAEGRYGWVLDRGTCLRNGEGRPYRMAGSLGDITPRKRGEQFLRSVVDTIPAALNIRDQEGRFVLMNQTLADYYGVDPKEAIGKLSEEIIPKTAMEEKEEAEIREVVETGVATTDSEYEYQRDGETKYWLTTRQPINDPVGQLQYVLTVAYEVTELRRAEQAMRESQQFLATLVDNIPAAVFFRDLEGRFIRVNRRWAEMFGITDESVRGKTVYDLFPKDRADDFTSYDREAIEQRQVLNREEKFKLQGAERIFDELNFPILDASGEVIAVGGVDVDITNLKEAQEALRQSQERLVQALESISEAFALCDAEDRLVLFNSRYRRMFFPFHEDFVQEGESFESITRRNVESGMVELGEQDPEIFLAERIERHRNPRGAFLQQQADGRWVQIDERKTEDGGIVAVGTDITELKKAEIDLTLARDEAMRATRAKSRFLANMSHELRTPMNAIIGFTRLVMRRSEDRLDPKQYGNLEKILISSEHLLSLINDILDISKIEAGHAVVQPVRFKLIEVVEDCLKTVEPLAESRRLTLVRQHDPDLPELQTDKEKLRQILINLLSNAVKFTEEGSVTVASRHEAGCVTIDVVDTGVGIPQESLERIFEEFSQVDDSSTRQFGGTGLGLAITCHLLGLLGGRIAVASKLGSGSTFTVSFPAHYVAPEGADAAQASAAEMAAGREDDLEAGAKR